MPEIKNGRLGLYGTEYSKCYHMMTLAFKGLRKAHTKPNQTSHSLSVRSTCHISVLMTVHNCRTQYNTEQSDNLPS